MKEFCIVAILVILTARFTVLKNINAPSMTKTIYAITGGLLVTGFLSFIDIVLKFLIDALMSLF